MSNLGSFGAVGIGRETGAAWGTGVVATRWFRATGESFRDGPEPIQEFQMYGTLDRAPVYKGMQVVEGGFTSLATPDELGELFRAALGNPVTTGVAVPYQHVFTPPQADFHANVCLPPYSVIMRRGAQVLQYEGCVLNSLNLSFAQGGLLMVDTDWIGQDVATPAAPTPVLPTDRPFGVTAAITRGGVAEATIQDLEFSINNNLEAVRLINNTELIGRVGFSGAREISLSGTADFRTEALYTQYKAFTGQAWTITWTYGATTTLRSLLLTIPDLLLDEAAANIGGDGRITIPFSGQAQYEPTLLYAALVTINTELAAYTGS